MFDAEFYNLTQSVADAFYGAMAVSPNRTKAEPPPPILQLRRGYAESPAWFMIQAAEFDPEPLTVSNLRVRDIYASESIVQALLELLASEKWLDRRDDGYYLTEAGRALLNRLRSRPPALIAALRPLPAAEVERLEMLLMQLITASLMSPSPPGIWCLLHSRRRAPAEAAAPLVKIFHYMADFNAFRDDAHMAAWQPHGIGGHVWEAFAFVCEGQANSARSLFDQLAYRGYSQGDYSAALAELVARGWLERVGDERFSVTEKGRVVRDGVERLTDQYFYAPWSALAEAEIMEVRHLLLRLRDGLQPPGGDGG